MNARTTFPTEAEAELITLARSIMAGDFTGLPRVDTAYYEREEWQSAADYAIDSDDYSELKFMLAMERGYDEYAALPETQHDAWRGFDNWFDRAGRKYLTGVAA